MRHDDEGAKLSDLLIGKVLHFLNDGERVEAAHLAQEKNAVMLACR